MSWKVSGRFFFASTVPQATSSGLAIFTVAMALACSLGGVLYDTTSWQGISNLAEKGISNFLGGAWNAKCPIFLGNFTPKTSNYCFKNRALGFPGGFIFFKIIIPIPILTNSFQMGWFNHQLTSLFLFLCAFYKENNTIILHVST